MVSRGALKVGLGLVLIAGGVLVLARYSAGAALIAGTLALLVLFWGVG